MTNGPWRLDPQLATDVLAMLRTARLVLLPTHQNVDADALASALAVSRALGKLGVESRVLVSDGTLPRSLGFLPGIDDVLLYG